MSRLSIAALCVAAVGAPVQAQTTPECDEREHRDYEPGELATLYFAPGSADLADASTVDLRRSTQWLARHPDRLLIVDGYADPEGSWNTNLRLSQQRAEEVRDALVIAGADVSRIVVNAHSENAPVSEANDCNRRVTIRGTLESFPELTGSQRPQPPQRARPPQQRR